MASTSLITKAAMEMVVVSRMAHFNRSSRLWRAHLQPKWATEDTGQVKNACCGTIAVLWYAVLWYYAPIYEHGEAAESVTLLHFDGFPIVDVLSHWLSFALTLSTPRPPMEWRFGALELVWDLTLTFSTPRPPMEWRFGAHR